MTPLEIVVLLVIAAVCGATGQALAGYSAGGCLASAVVGIIGAYIGQWLAREFDLPVILSINIGGKPFPIVWSIIGAFVFAAILGVVNRLTQRSRQ